MSHADAVLTASWIVPVEPADAVFKDHALVIQDGVILDLLPVAELEGKYTWSDRQDLNGHALIPGLVNAHTHAAMSLLKGMADDLPLMEWLQKHIWPAETRWVNDGFVRDGTRLAAAEMLLSGTTCFNDMYFFPDETARVASDMGIRANVGLIVIDFPTVWARDAAEYLSKGIEVYDAFRNDPLVTAAFAPHAPYTVSDEPLERVAVLAEELDIQVHMHLQETAFEIDESLKNFSARPMARLDSLGILSPRLMAVHMTQLEDAEIQRAAECGLHVVHCPESNLKLASGFCPVQRLADSGINVALGTDSAASNNDLDMLGEIRTAALLGKGVAGSASAVPAHTALRMATLNGARALGMDDRIGSLLPGKEADVVAIDLNTLDTQPVYEPVSQIVYASTRGQVSNVWVRGRASVRDGALVHADPEAIRIRAEEWRDRICP
ncbi:MAG: TRZ/ATZ family hydrolase [Gammaproteobacteria bacterium]|nr:MAG: TRZ/ATZ family hydrolase [Gammaproteobacteria bacterium]